MTNAASLLGRTAIVAMFCACLAAQDSLQLTDGRFIVDQRISRHEQGAVIHFRHGDILVPRELIRECSAFEIGADTTAISAEDQEHLDKGEVYFEGQWMPEKKRAKIMVGRRESRAKRIEEARAHRKWVNRHRLKTKNFEFEYTIDPEVMAKDAEMLEVYYKAFTKEWGIRKPRGMGRLKVCFYHDADYFQQVAGVPPGVLGYFKFVDPIELDFFYERLDRERTQDVMFHEANHYLTYLVDPEFYYPIWINEALAEYYGASEWDPKKKKMITGVLQEGRLAALKDEIMRDKWQGLEDLMRTTQRSFTSTHYAWAWSLVHFLLSDKKTEKKLKKLYLALGRDKGLKRVPLGMGIKTLDPDEHIGLFKRIMGVSDLSKLEKDWHDYVKSLKPATGAGYRSAGEIALSRGMPIKAQRLFKTALEMGETTCMTHFGFGRALYRKGKYREAQEQFEKATELDPLQGSLWMHLADAKERLNAPKEEIKRLRLLALDIEPDNYDLMVRLAMRDG